MTTAHHRADIDLHASPLRLPHVRHRLGCPVAVRHWQRHDGICAERVSGASALPAPEQKAELALAFTALNLGFTIPFVLGGPLAGAWADRHDRKQIMIATNLVNGLTTVLTLVLMLAGSLQVWMLVAIGIFAGACAVFALLRSQILNNSPLGLGM
jgi:MFS family permease